MVATVTKTPPPRLKPSRLNEELADFTRSVMKKTGTPGVAVGVLHKGRAQAGGFGITSVDAPSPVDAETLFQIGSTTKTFTASAVMRLVERGALDLDVPVRRYLRDLRLADADVTRRVTLRHLLTHMGGWAGDYFVDTGRGDDALAKAVAKLRTVPQLTPLGAVWHYNNAGFYIAGRVLEKVTGKPYETVIREELFEPLGMTRSFFFADEAIVYRAVAGHVAKGTKHSIARPWAIDRSANAAGAIISDVVDQLRWAQFHMGDGRVPNGKRLLKVSTMREMQRPQTPPGDILDSTGVSWLIQDVGGVRTVAHGGTTNGQLSAFLMVPERQFAVTVLTNSTRGGEVHRAVTGKALEQFLGVVRPVLTPSRNGADLRTLQGRYVSGLRNVALDLVARDSHLVATYSLLKSDEDPGLPPFKLALCDDEVAVIQGGRLNGYKAQFLRDERGRVRWLRLGGRLYRKGR